MFAQESLNFLTIITLTRSTLGSAQFLRFRRSEKNVHYIHALRALSTDAKKSLLSSPYNEVLAQSTKSLSCTPRRRGVVGKRPEDKVATFSASATSANGVTVIWVSPPFGHPHSPNPSNMGIPCNPSPNR